MPTLYDSIAFGNKTARNRVVMAPMLTTQREIDGFPTPWHIDFYRRRAADGPGTVIVECTATNRDGRNSLGELGLYKQEHIPAMREVARAIREGGSLAIVQIHHAGRATPARVNVQPYAPSGETLKDGREVRAMTDEQVETCAGEFVASIVRAKEAGFDGVELHGCHGYLLNQFASPVTNRRDGRWGGGTVEDRLSFARSILAGARAAVGEDFVIGYRMGFNDPDAPTGVKVGQALEGLGADYLHISGGIGPGAMPEGGDGIHGFWLAARAVREAVGIPVIAVNSIHTLELAERVVAEGFGDAAAVARPYLLNGDWMAAQREGRELITCLKCKGGCRYLADGCPFMRLPS